MAKGGVSNKSLGQYGRQMAKIKNQGYAKGGLIPMAQSSSVPATKKPRFGKAMPAMAPQAGPGLPMKKGGKVC